MNPPCARCKKTVYPMEKLNCLDKVWHKACFTCEQCNLKLTMKTYKGYNKLPYCNTHYPTTRFTAVADTPENKRLAQQTRNQSELTYRKDKVEALSHFTPVSDSVAGRQATQASKLASQIGYQTAPHEQEHPAGYNQPPPGGYTQPPQPVMHQMPPQQMPPPQMPVPTHQAPPPAGSRRSGGPRWVAIYDYTAADEDEISFNEGDEIVEVTVIDEGWMEGRVKKTGQYGMLPSNYVEKV